MEQSRALPTKVYVRVAADFDENGRCLPRAIIWENGRKYDIDRVTDIRQAAAMRAGGQGDRFTVWVRGQQSYLFFERSTDRSGPVLGRWFVERRGA